MSERRIDYTGKLSLLLVLLVFITEGCNPTKYLKKDQYLLRQNTIKLQSKNDITNKSEIKDNLSHIVEQKPNTYTLGIPLKLLLYNSRYQKYQKDTSNYQLKSKTVEKPVILDTSLTNRTVQDMKSYMFNQGYFYAHVNDSIRFKKQQAYVTYTVKTGNNYLINKVTYDANDSIVEEILQNETAASGLQKNTEFSMSLLEDERSRIVSVLRDHGYYRFSQDNVNFVLDTVNKKFFRDVESPLEGAVDFITQEKDNKRPELDIQVIVRPTDDPAIYRRYGIKSVTIYPDYDGRDDIHDSTMLEKEINGVLFKYHNYYVKSSVIYKHIYLLPGRYYAQSDYDKTITKLNELGIFQYIHVVFRQDSVNNNMLDCRIELNRTKKHDFSSTYEISNGTTYTLGNSLSLSFRDRNLAKGANLLTVTVNGGIETVYDETIGNTFVNHFFILTKYYGYNASIDFPKFIAPIASRKFANSNLPHTIIGVGTNFMDRVDYFTLVNTSANFSYNWHETSTKTWDLSPAFINVIRLPKEADSFKHYLETNEFLRDSYKQNFIEGENVAFTFSNMNKKRGQNYSYIRVGAEEAGIVLSTINGIGNVLNNLYNIQYAQYGKFDFDARHYFTFPKSTVALRFQGGLGIPYGQSTALPYIKQYFVGGPYSLRGWRIRSLGPGSYYDPNLSNVNFIDRTGDIKLESNAEFRFFIANLFAGAIKFNGALFADAGNIWLAQPDSQYPGGEFSLNTLGQDIAMDLGTGARFDISSFLTLRLDVGFPVKKPYVFTNSGWVFNQIAPFDKSWRANNLVLGLSIGYPF